MKTVFVRASNNYDTMAASNESAIRCEDPSLAQQHCAEECDINTIVKRFQLTGQLPENVRAPNFGDFEEAFDFHSAMNAIRQAEESFMAMPADQRYKFHNDPQEFVEFCSNPENLPAMRKMGLAVPEVLPATEKSLQGPEKGLIGASEPRNDSTPKGGGVPPDGSGGKGG